MFLEETHLMVQLRPKITLSNTVAAARSRTPLSPLSPDLPVEDIRGPLNPLYW